MPNHSSLKLGSIVLGIISTLLLFIFGSVLPFLKSQAYIEASRNVANIHTIQDFKTNFDNVFNFYSPVGGEESAKFLLGNIISVVSSQQDQQESVTRELINYIEPKIYPDTRHYISMANLYTVALTRFKKVSDYNAAIGYYLKARESGPKLPPVLYGLISLYQASGDTKNTKEVAQTILQYWPQDTRVTDLLAAESLPNKKK